MAVVVTIILIVLVGGTLVALGWWKLADVFFPGSSRRPARPDPNASATVLRDPAHRQENDGPEPR